MGVIETGHWYYKIETESGEFTPGREIGTLPIVRRFLQRIDFTDQRVLDIGTQEFVTPILVGRRDPKEIVAYDRLDLSTRFDFLKTFYPSLAKTTYVHGPGLPLNRLKSKLKTSEIDPVFDVVIFTGVLYHMPDPMAGLAMARSFLREGGLMLFETSVSTDSGYTAEFNASGRLYPGSNYFQVAPKTIDYMCRALRMRVLDAFWRGEGPQVRRLFMVLRGEADAVAPAEDKWIRKQFVEADMRPWGLQFKELGDQGRPPVAFADPAPNAETGVLDVNQYIRDRDPIEFDTEYAILKHSHEI